MNPHLRDTTIDTVSSQCPECGKPIASVIVDRGGKVYQRPQCSCHESTDSLIFSDADLYRRLDEWNKLVFPDAQQAAPAPGGACDCATVSHNEPCLAVIDITNRCNYKCPVCFAEATGDGNHYFFDTELVGKMLQSLLDRPVPCRHIQFSGGEPTLHPEFPAILRTARDLGFTHIQVATNGSRFVNPDYAKLCEDSGLHTLYLQFDGVNDEVYIQLRGQRLLDKKIAAVNNVEKTNMRLVLVPTIVTSINVDQLGPIFQFALEHSSHVTGISIQPAAHVGRVEIADETSQPFNLATMAREFGRQTGLTRFPDDWFPLNSISLISRALDRVRRDATIPPLSDAHCSLGTFFYVDDNNKPFCLSSFFDLDRFFRNMAEVTPDTAQGIIERQISRIRQFRRLSQCFDKRKAPEGLTFQRMLRSMEGWEDKSKGRSAGWCRKGFNGIFVAGMHFMDARSYNLRRLQRCIIQYVATDGQLIPFCNYNAGARLRSAEELIRLENDPSPRPADCGHADGTVVEGERPMQAE